MCTKGHKLNQLKMSQNKYKSMKIKVLFLLSIIGLTSFSANAQRGVRIGYIDTEYILQNVPEYAEASNQLDKKVLQWKSEIEQKLSVIEQKKKELENESVLLTKELYEERMEDISFEEAEILDYQQKRFGPQGDMIIQKRQLIEPVQDQIFAAVQQIAETKKFDFVFDKSADVVMLYSAERYDISDQVLRTITRSSKRNQAKNKKERKALENEEVVPVVSDEKDERQRALDERKAKREAELAAKRAEREKILEARRAKQDSLRAARKREADAKRNKTKAERDQKVEESTKKEEASAKADETKKEVEVGGKNTSDNTLSKTEQTVKPVAKDSTTTKKALTAAEIKANDREKRRKALEEKKKKIMEQRKKAREEREKQLKKRDSIAKAKRKEQQND